IFRRADKDDDGKLSLEEFQAFFSDGTLNEEELEKLFHTIDSDNTRLLCQSYGGLEGSSGFLGDTQRFHRKSKGRHQKGACV
ncbi:unnamed protein product, partial [Tetraodon nigroviridis]